MKLTKEQIVSIIKKVGCPYCEVKRSSRECMNCEEYCNFIPNNIFIDQVNELLEDKWNNDTIK